MHMKNTFSEIEYLLNIITKKVVDQMEFQINKLRIFFIIKQNY